MLLTDKFSGILKNEKNILFDVAKGVSGSMFSQSDKNPYSFYKSYDESVHLDDVLSEIRMEDLDYLRKQLLKMWAGSVKKDCIPVILSSLNKLENMGDKYLPDVDLHNYMI